MNRRDAFREAYARAMLWANAYKGDPKTGKAVPDEDATYVYDTPGRWWEDFGLDFDDADSFLEANEELLASASLDFSQHGHDFALTRNHHGAGFWDRGYGEVGEELTHLAEAYGEAYVWTNDGPTVVNE